MEKAKGCEDFKHPGTKALMVIEIHEIIQAMLNDQKFRQIALSLMQEAETTCGDRVALYLNYIRVKRLLSQSKELDETALARLLIRLARLEALDNISSERAKASVDPIETILGYQVLLRETLDLPLATRQMLYLRCANIAEGQLESAKIEVLNQTKNTVATLLSFSEWKDRLRKVHASDFEKIDDAFPDPEIIEDETNNEYLTRVDTVKNQREAAMEKAYEELTALWLKGNEKNLLQN